MRIAIGGLSHETNQYVGAPTVLADFNVTRGSETFRRHAGRTYIGGMLDAAAELGIDVVGTQHAVAQPSGSISADTYAALKEGLLESISLVMPCDAVVLELHGAAAAVGIDDVEADVCVAVRELVGPALTFVVTHDLHGNVSQLEADAVSAMFACRHYPHDDMYETGRRAVESVPRIMSREWKPRTSVEAIPLLIPTLSTYEGPGAKALEICRAVELVAGVLECTFMHGFPYADNPVVGASVVVMTNDDPDLARETAQRVAAEIWTFRTEFQANYLDPADAVEQAMSGSEYPVVINETSDNPGGGAPCDGTFLLRALLQSGVEDSVFVGIRDPEVVAHAMSAGVGSTIEIALGGKTDAMHGEPIVCSAYVKLLTDGDTTLEAPMGRGWLYPLGQSARLIIDGIDVIVISNRVQTIDRTALLLHGIDPLMCRIIALKSSQHFRSGFKDIARRILTTDPPGLTTMRIETFTKIRSRRPMYPLDVNAQYSAGLVEA